MSSCGCLVLEKVEGDAAAKARVKAAPGAGAGAGCGSCAGDWRGRSEAIFPIYVMGSSRGSTVAAARGIVDSPEDPIWVSVKAEAKSEVSMLQDLDWRIGWNRSQLVLLFRCLCHADDELKLRLFGWRWIAISFHGFWFWASYLRIRLTIF